MTSQPPLPPWRPLLRGAREREGRLPQARWLQLAIVATDARSAKVGELKQQPSVELAWLLPKARCQFRLRGSLRTLPAEAETREIQRLWQALSPSGRALWGWPQPGAPLELGAQFPSELGDDLPIPDHFQLLRIGLTQVELLELTAHPHRRRRWCQDDGWREQALNP